MSSQEIIDAAEDAPEPVDNDALADLPRNDIGNAERFIARHGRDVRQTQRFGVFVWNGTHWRLDDGGVAINLKAQLTAKCIRTEELAAVRERDGAPPGAPPAEETPAQKKTREQREERLEGFARFASSSGNASKCKNMIELALPHLQHGIDQWNNKPHAFNLPNGTLDLEGVDFKLRAHRREDYLTCMAGVAYDPDAECPLFKSTIERVLPDKSVRDFVQRYFGASLVDSSGDQAIVIHHGGGSNGKSTIIDAIAHAMGSYAVTTDVSMLLHSDAKAAGGGPQPSLIKLANGARLVRAAEPELGMRLSESLIKQLTGGEPMEARDMWAKPIEFVPRFKLSLSCNARPPIRGGDHGIWRRLLLVPWHVQISAEEKDAELPGKLKLEAAGILNWLLAGWEDWHMNGGLRPPAEVLAATEEYRADSDPVGRFLSEWCDRDATERVEANELHAAFAAWCGREQMKVLPLAIFGRRLTDRAIEKQESHGKTYRKGFKLNAEGIAALEAARQAESDRQFDRESRRHGKRSDTPPDA